MKTCKHDWRLVVIGWDARTYQCHVCRMTKRVQNKSVPSLQMTEIDVVWRISATTMKGKQHIVTKEELQDILDNAQGGILFKVEEVCR